MAYVIEFTRRSEKQLESLPGQAQQRIRRSIDDLANDPRPHGAIKMKLYQDTYRIRVGDYRILYEVHDDRLLVTVVKVGDRGDVYR